MNEARYSILVVGGAETGKTNYIIRLWLALKDQRGMIRLAALPDQIEDIEADVHRLLSGAFAGRTIGELGAEFVIPFRIDGSEILGELVVPDFSGEEWDRAFLNRQWPESWDIYLEHCVGCLVFVRSNVLVAPLNWVEVAGLLIKARAGEFEGFGDLSPDVSETEFPTQTQVVDWLQFLSHAIEETRDSPPLLRVGIVVAGWDELEKEATEQGPKGYIEKNLPLLNQFLETNDTIFRFRVFGSSVVGGDLKHDDQFRNRYLEGNPVKSGYIITDVDSSPKKSKDFSLPIAWLLGVQGK